jgi:hypothetical protein
MAPRPEKLIAFRAADSDCKSQDRTLSSADRRDIIVPTGQASDIVASM